MSFFLVNLENESLLRTVSHTVLGAVNNLSRLWTVISDGVQEEVFIYSYSFLL